MYKRGVKAPELTVLTLEARVPSGGNSSRLDDFLAGLLAAEESKRGLSLRVTKTKIRRLLMAGAVNVDARTVRQAAWEVRPGQKVRAKVDLPLFTAEKDPGDLVFELTSRDILFEDDWILVLNKPAGLPTEGTVVANRDSLHSAALRYLKNRPVASEESEPYLGLHHRLDRETSGVILFTKTREANRPVHEMFLHHQAQKIYQALTVLPPRAKFGADISEGDVKRIENHLGRISASSVRGKWGEVLEGDWAATDLTVVRRGRGCVLWEARPLTGRTHQIRVHLAGLGYPLLGDELYGGPRKVGEITIPRVMLHAQSLTFPHPITGGGMTVSAPLPADFNNLIRGLIPKASPGKA